MTDYLAKADLQRHLDTLGFNLVGYGCTTCIGNSGPLHPAIEEAVTSHDVVAASVLSGNRNFEARVHQNIKANFLMSPPLVVAFALAGRVDLDLTTEPLGTGRDGQPVYLRDLWPTLAEIREAMQAALKPAVFRRLYSELRGPESAVERNPLGGRQRLRLGPAVHLHPGAAVLRATSVRQAGPITEIRGARPLGIFGDSVTTDHISPAGSIKKTSPAGQFLLEHGVAYEDFNSYGSRRGNDRVMTRGTFANVRIKNLMLGGEEGGDTLLQPEGTKLPSTKPPWSTSGAARRSSSSPARSMAPAPRATGRPRAPACSG